MRSLGDCPSKPATSPRAGFESLECEIQVVTPLFGGGTETGVPDAVTLIRPTSIRGHLRFWWRATRGARFTSTEALRQREIEIFGDTEHPSPLIVEVRAEPWTERRTSGDYGFDRFGPESYALFPAKQKAVLCREGMKFSVRFCWLTLESLQLLRDRENRERKRQKKEPLSPISDITPDLHSAVRAWLNFGGLGARTRRGCGSLYCLSANPPFTVGLPSDSSIRVLVRPTAAENALRGWADALSVYREFRQKQRRMKRRLDRKSGKEKEFLEGRSLWPEPDSIRGITGCASPKHNQPAVDKQSVGAFPRGALGMPIIFWFKDGPGKDRLPMRDKDPCNAELVPEALSEKGQVVTGTRMASPIITKALFHQGSWHPAVIVLPHAHVSQMSARIKVQGLEDGTVRSIEEKIDKARITGPALAGLKPMLKKESAVEAFIAFATSEPWNFQEVRV